MASNKKDSFVGSDFSYGDISLPKVDQYRHTLLRTEKIDGADCYVIECVPANDAVRANSGYGRKLTWVRADNFVESKVEYYDLAGRLLKTQTVSRHELVEPQKARWFALQREMTNHQNGHRTVLTHGQGHARRGGAGRDVHHALHRAETEVMYARLVDGDTRAGAVGPARAQNATPEPEAGADGSAGSSSARA